jgi:lysozyme family protein
MRLVELQDRTSGRPRAGMIAGEIAVALQSLNLTQLTTPDWFTGQQNRGPAPTFASLEAEYAKMLTSCAVQSAHRSDVQWHLQVLTRYRDRYASVAKKTGVPWYVVGIIHAREASFNFRGHLHNGDSLTRRTTHVPRNRPAIWLPPADWESSAVDALTLEGFAGKSDWSDERTLYRLEAFNGFGYRRLNKPSPYLWSFSQHYKSGKFVADGKFKAEVVDQQCGVAVLYRTLLNAGAINA